LQIRDPTTLLFDRLLVLGFGVRLLCFELLLQLLDPCFGTHLSSSWRLCACAATAVIRDGGPSRPAYAGREISQILSLELD